MAEIERQYLLRELIDLGIIRLSERKLRAIVQEMGFQPSQHVGKYCFTASQVREIQEYVGASKRHDRTLPEQPRETAREVIAKRRREGAEKKKNG